MADITTLGPEQHEIVDSFHKLYYPFFSETKWLGSQAAKCPFDLFVYQEIIHQLRPDLIIEGGTYDGGSALFMASICELIEHGEVITIDIDGRARPAVPRVTYWTGSTLSPEIITAVRQLVAGKKTVLVILDDDHTCDHVLNEMQMYSSFVTPGSYLIVEDTNINGHPVLNDFGRGPMEAVDLFLHENSDFEVDRSREKFFVSFNPRGYLRKVGHPAGANGVPETGFRDSSLRVEGLESQIARFKDENAKLLSQLATIEGSVGWKILERYRRVKEFLLPSNSSLRKYYESQLRRWR